MIYRQTCKSAGADLSASVETIIPARKIVLVGTGYKLWTQVPNVINQPKPDIFYLLTARSSLAYKTGLLLANGVGVIDSDYKDEIKVMLFNPTNEDVIIEAGTRIAQLIAMPFLPVFPALDNERNGGFGSTS